MNSRSSAVEIFDAIFHPAPPVAQCATSGCDRRPALYRTVQGQPTRSRFCACCLQDRIEGRAVVKRAADEILPFTREMERKSSAGPCPFMTKGDAGCRDVKRNRKNGKYKRDKFAHPSGDPRKCVGISFSPAGLRTTRAQ